MTTIALSKLSRRARSAKRFLDANLADWSIIRFAGRDQWHVISPRISLCSSDFNPHAPFGYVSLLDDRIKGWGAGRSLAIMEAAWRLGWRWNGGK